VRKHFPYIHHRKHSQLGKCGECELLALQMEDKNLTDEEREEVRIERTEHKRLAYAERLALEARIEHAIAIPSALCFLAYDYQEPTLFPHRVLLIYFMRTILLIFLYV